ncbi:MAG: hypothetical protein OEX08_02815 [Candidatus Nomurabacteria bacterium]|nr:hypothetical protein [Candidatus Nomurabacteria bacterium]
MNISRIILPTRTQPDTLVAIFLLQQFGQEKYPGIKDASVVVDNQESREFSQALAEGDLLLDVGGGPLDHHNQEKQITASRLVVRDLEVEKDRSIQYLLGYAERDDFYGKGTVSKDPLDRAFGLSGMIANLNRVHNGDAQKITNIIIPLLFAHYEENRRRFEDMPREVDQAFKEKRAYAFRSGKDSDIKVVAIQSDNASLAGYLRSGLGGKHDIVIQQLGSGHTNILTNQKTRVDLSKLIGLIRYVEIKLADPTISLTPTDLQTEGNDERVPHWYYDPATNSLLNGGVHPGDTQPSIVAFRDFKDLVEKAYNI